MRIIDKNLDSATKKERYTGKIEIRSIKAKDISFPLGVTDDAQDILYSEENGNHPLQYYQ